MWFSTVADIAKIDVAGNNASFEVPAAATVTTVEVNGTGATVENRGTVTTVEVKADNATVENKGTVTNITVDNTASGAKIANSGAVNGTVDLGTSGDAKLTNEGTGTVAATSGDGYVIDNSTSGSGITNNTAKNNLSEIKFVDLTAGAESKARSNKGHEVFDADAWDFTNHATGKILTSKIDGSQKATDYDVTNKAVTVAVKVKGDFDSSFKGTKVPKHYSGGGKLGCWVGFSLKKETGDEYCLVGKEKLTDVTTLEYGTSQFSKVHWTDETNAYWYADLADIASGDTFCLVVRHDAKAELLYTIYEVTFDVAIDATKQYQFDATKDYAVWAEKDVKVGSAKVDANGVEQPTESTEEALGTN